MSAVIESPAQSAASDTAPIVNDFSIMACTKNGSGSQTANSTILRSIFKMGVPVVGKNVFPSNIQGRPTWYTIRANKDGYTARTDRPEIVIAINPESAMDDYAQTAPGGIFIYSDEVKIPLQREDVSALNVPVKKIADALETDVRLKTYGRNMAYVGALAWLIGMDLTHIASALKFHFKGKMKPVESNMKIVNAAFAYAAENWKINSPFKVAAMEATKGMIMMTGNEASAIGAVYGGLNFMAWYPITPATSFGDALGEHMEELRKGPDGKPTYSIIQAEDELAALGMVVGAGWAGARAMTNTSGPGISLMTEFTGYAYFAEIPAVILDVSRMGPSTGLPTRTSQADIMKLTFLGHGDTKNIVLVPGNLEEAFEHGWKALDIAERYQTPVFIMSDLDLGMNNWMGQPFEYPDREMDRGKVLNEEDLNRLKGFARYRDVDGDGIGWRTLPGTNHPLASYFTRGSGHNELAGLTEKSEDWVKNMDRLGRKYETARKHLSEFVAPEVELVDGAEISIITLGTAMHGVKEARARLAKEGYKISCLRIKAVPLADSIKDFVAKHKRNYIVEMTHDGQLKMMLQLHMPDMTGKLVASQKNDGMPLTARWIMDSILTKEQAAK